MSRGSVNKVILIGNLGQIRGAVHAEWRRRDAHHGGDLETWKDKSSGEKPGKDRMAPAW